MGPWPSSSSPALASLGRAGCPLGGCISLCSSMSFHSLIYSVNKELSQQWPSYSRVCWSQSDSQPPWTHWFYSLGRCSDQTYTLCRRWCLQSAVNSNKAKPDLRGDIWMESMRDHTTSRIALLSSFVLFLPFLPPCLPLPSISLLPFLPFFFLAFLPPFSLSLLLSRYSYQSPAMENTEFLLAHW